MDPGGLVGWNPEGRYQIPDSLTRNSCGNATTEAQNDISDFCERFLRLEARRALETMPAPATRTERPILLDQARDTSVRFIQGVRLVLLVALTEPVGQPTTTRSGSGA